jgi:hypothetical protein
MLGDRVGRWSPSILFMGVAMNRLLFLFLSFFVVTCSAQVPELGIPAELKPVGGYARLKPESKADWIVYRAEGHNYNPCQVISLLIQNGFFWIVKIFRWGGIGSLLSGTWITSQYKGKPLLWSVILVLARNLRRGQDPSHLNRLFQTANRKLFLGKVCEF